MLLVEQKEVHSGPPVLGLDQRPIGHFQQRSGYFGRPIQKQLQLLLEQRSNGGPRQVVRPHLGERSTEAMTDAQGLLRDLIGQLQVEV